MINYNELLPVLLIGLVCAFITCMDSLQKTKDKEIKDERNSTDNSDESGIYDATLSHAQNNALPDKLEIPLLTFVRNLLYGTIFAVFLFWLTLALTDIYQLRLGIVGLVSIMGLDRALGLVERVLSMRKA